MKFDIKKFFGLSKEKFEEERTRAIEELIQTAEPAKQDVYRQFQKRIDDARKSMSTEEFMKWLLHELNEANLNLDDQLVRLERTLKDSLPNKTDEPPSKI